MPVATQQSRFVWYDLMTTDPKGAQSFYKTVTGWGTQDWADPAMQYTMWTAGGAPIGGVMQLPKEAQDAGAPPHWLGYVGVADINDTYKRAMEAGASSYVPPSDIPNVGKFAVLADPQGATFALFSPEGASGDSSPPPAGHISWHELASSDYKAGQKFYFDLFGWTEKQAMDMGGGMIYSMYGPAGSDEMLGGMYDKMPEQPVSAWTYYFTVPDINRAVEIVRENGGQVLNGPMEVPGGSMIAQCMDPQGAVFAVHQTNM